LADDRLARINEILTDPLTTFDDLSISYIVPWTDTNLLGKESVDIILSHAVLEHVVDLDGTYNSLVGYLKHGGMMTHQIDFDCHGLSAAWNGYRTYPEFIWKMILGKRPFLINRIPCTEHIRHICENNCMISCLLKSYRSDGIDRSKLAAKWKNITDDDLNCTGAFLQAKKI
jgi:hypothetical protein